MSSYYEKKEELCERKERLRKVGGAIHQSLLRGPVHPALMRYEQDLAHDYEHAIHTHNYEDINDAQQQRMALSDVEADIIINALSGLTDVQKDLSESRMKILDAEHKADLKRYTMEGLEV